MKDRLKNELNIGDLCVCYNNMGTGSSTCRLVQYEGEIIGFTSKLIKIKCVKCLYAHRIGQEFKCSPENVFKVNEAFVEKKEKSIGRCGECKHSWNQDEYGYINCTNLHVIMKQDDFCSLFEHKETKLNEKF